MTASSDWIVNIGTLILAVAAVVSAIFAAVTLKTSNKVLESATKQASATEKLAEVTTAIFIASSLPLLADVPQHRGVNKKIENRRELVPVIERDSDGEIIVTIPTQNVGAGPAIVKSIMFKLIDGTEPGIRGTSAQTIVPSGATTLILAKDPAELNSAKFNLATLTTKQFCAIVDYSDYSGMRHRRTVLYVTTPDGHNSFIRGLDVHECDSKWNIVGSPVITNRG